MNNRQMTHMCVLMLVVTISLLPVQVAFSQTSITEDKNTPQKTSAEVLYPLDSTKSKIDDKIVLDETSKEAVTEKPEGEDDERQLSTGMMIGIGAGAAVLVGGGIALAGGGGGEDAPVVPPTADQLVSAWHAEGNQPGSGRTYTGTYHLYQGGSLGYDLLVNTGEHLVGSGSWRVSEYQLQIHTDHGSLYSGSFVPGNYTTINMNANTQWNLTLTR